MDAALSTIFQIFSLWRLCTIFLAFRAYGCCVKLAELKTSTIFQLFCQWRQCTSMKALKHTWKLKCSWKAISLTLSETYSIPSFHGIRMLRKALGFQNEYNIPIIQSLDCGGSVNTQYSQFGGHMDAARSYNILCLWRQLKSWWSSRRGEPVQYTQ